MAEEKKPGEPLSEQIGHEINEEMIISEKAEKTSAKKVEEILENRRLAEDRLEVALGKLLVIRDTVPVAAAKYYAHKLQSIAKRLETAPIYVEVKPLENQELMMKKAAKIFKKSEEEKKKLKELKEQNEKRKKLIEEREKNLITMAQKLKNMCTY